MRNNTWAAAMVVVLGACAEWKTGGNIGGANRGLKVAGNVPGGIRLAAGDVAVAGLGNMFAMRQDRGVVTGNTGEAKAQELSAMPDAELLVFFTNGEGAFLGKRDGDAVVVKAWRKSDNATLWETRVNARAQNSRQLWMDLAKGGNSLVVTGQDVVVVNTVDGAIQASYRPQQEIHDVDITKDGNSIILTEGTAGVASVTVERRSVDNPGSDVGACQATSANCPGETELARDDSVAFMAPTLCQQDPVSVFALGADTCEEKALMPGFGPVAMSPDGNTAAAFIDKNQLGFGMEVPSSVTDSKDRYHLMFINVDTLGYTTVPAGDTMPRYAYTPDGSALLVDTPMDPFSTARVLDLAHNTFRNFKGAPVKLHNFAFSLDGKKLFVRDDLLVEVDMTSLWTALSRVDLVPDGLNVTSDGKTVVLGNLPQDRVHFVDAQEGTERGTANTDRGGATVATR